MVASTITDIFPERVKLGIRDTTAASSQNFGDAPNSISVSMSLYGGLGEQRALLGQLRAKIQVVLTSDSFSAEHDAVAF